MAAAHVQNLGSTGNGTAAQTSTVLSPTTKTVTAGNTIVVGWGCYYNITPSGVTDNLGNSYTRVERSTRTASTADLWYAPVTSGGSITTITVAHDSTQYVAIMAVELSGVAAGPSVGGGLTGTATNTGTWVDNKSLAAGALAIGWVASSGNSTETAGAASGSPSTSITLSAFYNGAGNMSGSICYAIAGGSAVTGFSGTTTFTNETYAGAGAIFTASATTPTWTTPADTVSMSTTPELKFTSPVSAVKQHFYLQLDTADTFDTGDLREYDSSSSQTNWAYWDGDSWENLPSDGLPIAMSGNEVRYTVTSALSSTTWYRRVRAGTLT